MNAGSEADCVTTAERRLEVHRFYPPYGILGGTMETSASFEARSAPSSYPINDSAFRTLTPEVTRAIEWPPSWAWAA